MSVLTCKVPFFDKTDPTGVRGMIPSKSQISSVFFFYHKKAVPSDIQPQASTGE